MITTEVLPATRWRDPREPRLVLALPPAGVLIGADRLQVPVALPAVGPEPTRLGVLGDHRVATLLAYRLLGVGCRLTVATTDPARWRRLLAVAGDRAMIVPSPLGWPPEPPDQPAAQPELLVTDLPAAPPAAQADRPFSTVLHVATAVPDGPFWSGAHGVLVAGGGYGGPLAHRLGRPDAVELDQLGPGQLGVLDRDRAVVVTPILAEAELALLTD